MIAALLVAPWLGQGAAFAYSMDVSPQSGRVGTTVSVTLADFGARCAVFFDGAPVASADGCDGPTTLVFEVPESAAVGDHEVRGLGGGLGTGVADQTLPFVVRATPVTTAPPATAAPISSPPVSTSSADVVVGKVGEVGGTTIARPDTTRGTASTTTVPPGATGQPGTISASGALAVAKSGPARFAASCPPRQVALMRFAVAPTRGRPGGSVSGSTSWGAVGTCTEIRALRVILDGKTVPGTPPEAGTSGKFAMSVPRDAKPGRHTLSLVADEDPSVALATVAFQVEKAPGSTATIIGLSAAGVAVLLALVVLRRRRRRGGRRVVDHWADDDEGGGWGGVLEVPDIADLDDLPDRGTGMAPTVAVQVAVPVPVPGPAGEGMVVEDNPTMPVVPLVVASGRHGSYYLLERQNPHAPRRPNGKRGWYRDQRTQPIRGIVVDTVEPHTAGAAASELAMGETPVSAHVVVDVDGPLDLLPDDIVAVHRPEHDEATLVMLLAGVGSDPASDEVVLRHAAVWATAKMGEHTIPAHVVTGADFEAGEPGLLAGGTVPWHRIVNLAEPPAQDDQIPADEAPVVDLPVPAEAQHDAGEAAEAVVDAVADAIGGPGEGDDEIDGVEAVAVVEPEDDDSGAGEVEPEPSIEIEGPRPTGRDAGAAEAIVDAATEMVGGVDAAEDAPEGTLGEAMTTGPPMAVDEAPTRAPRVRRALPTPDELIAQVMAEPDHFLVDHENPHATLRANGRHGWYYPTRYGGIRAVVLHSLAGGDTADEVAAHLATVDQPEAAHAVVDPDAIVELLPDDATALHGVRSSSAAIDLALAYDPSAWGSDPAREDALLVRAATWAGVRAVRHGIPVRRITVDEWHTGQGGIAANGDRDPGPDFPWDRFLQLTAWVAGRVASSQPPPPPPATSPSETVRSGIPPT